VAKQQPVFHFADIAGTLVGFRAPKYTKDLTVPGYHLHFLSADGGAGGHVLAFTLESGKLEVDSCHRFLLILPENDGAFGGLDLEQDRSRELHQVEK
jgi:acetolactate decarboxylase